MNKANWFHKTPFLVPFFDEQALKINRSDRSLLFCFAVVLIHPSLIQLQKGRTSNRKIRASLLSSPEKDCNKKNGIDWRITESFTISIFRLGTIIRWIYSFHFSSIRYSAILTIVVVFHCKFRQHFTCGVFKSSHSVTLNFVSRATCHVQCVFTRGIWSYSSDWLFYRGIQKHETNISGYPSWSLPLNFLTIPWLCPPMVGESWKELVT